LRYEELDRILRSEGDIEPSPRFHASVMEAIHREAATPEPIPFPWKRAWPAVAAAALTLVISPVLLFESAAAAPPGFDVLHPAAASVGAPWIALAALATAGCLFLSRRLAEGSY
jgi:hypothetical protein